MSLYSSLLTPLRTPKTPSAGTGMETPETPRTHSQSRRRSSSSSRMSIITLTPGGTSSSHPSRGASSSRGSLPSSFRQEMPSSTRKRREEQKKEEIEPPSKRVGSINQVSFYGTRVSPKTTTPSPEKSTKNKKKEDISPPKSASTRRSHPRETHSRPRRSGSFNGSKRRRASYEINKGVGHAIKRPNVKQAKPQKEKKKLEPVTPKNSGRSSSKKDYSTVFNNYTSTKTSGDLTSSVSYFVKNGVPCFFKRSSGATPPCTTPGSINRRTPKLFSSRGDFLNPSPSGSPNNKRVIPSPVKFISNSQEEDAIEHDVSGILETLEEEDDKEEGNKGKDDKYAVYVDDDAYKMACDAVQELAEISGCEELALSYTDTPEKENQTRTPRKSPRLTPRKQTPVKASPRVTPRKQTPVKASARLTPRKQTPVKASPRTPKGSKVYPVFQRNAKTGINEELSSNPVAKVATQKVLKVRDENQTIIDAGQKKIGATNCDSCNCMYTPGDAADEKRHEKVHNRHLGIVGFAGWKNENVCLDDEECRVIVVRSNGTEKRHWEKAEEVLEVVDSAMGISPAGKPRQPSRSEAYLCIVDKRVAGFLLVEPLMENDRVATSYVEKNVRVTSDDKNIKDKARMVGVSRIWVHSDYQRRGLATRMMDAMRMKYRMPMRVERHELAFTHTSPAGAKFVETYAGKKFLVYGPALAGAAK